MTTMQFYEVCKKAVEQLRAKAPKDTGNLAYNSIQYEFKGDTCNIYINEDIAPYMPFTNEKWVAKRWNGKQNPNEQWFDNAVKFIVDEIRKELK